MEATQTTDNLPWDSPERQREYLAEYIGPDTLIYTRQTHGRGETDYLEVFIPDGDTIRNITWMVARANGWRVRDHQGRRMIAMAGGFYSKGLDLYLGIRQALGFSEDQNRHMEL